jgi:hypothetical protein
MLPNPYNEPVAGQLADLLSAARAVGRAEVMGANIAAIAVARRSLRMEAGWRLRRTRRIGASAARAPRLTRIDEGLLRDA